jgi:hypothetical protein
VERLVNATPSVKLSEDPVSDELSSRENPEDEESVVELSQEMKVLAHDYWMNQGLSREEAVERAKAELSTTTESK